MLLLSWKLQAGASVGCGRAGSAVTQVRGARSPPLRLKSARLPLPWLLSLYFPWLLCLSLLGLALSLPAQQGGMGMGTPPFVTL